MIYVDNLTDYTTIPPDKKVVEINGKGYYMWNGKKWVNAIGQDGQEWAYNPTNQRIELVRVVKKHLKTMFIMIIQQGNI